MSLSVRQSTSSDTVSLMDLAEQASMDTPVSLRALLQRKPPEDVISYGGEISYNRLNWENWVDDHGGQRLEATPSSKAELFATVDENKNNSIRAVGSGHSHSKAPVPEGRYIDLKHLTGTLDSNGWLKDTSELEVDDKKYLVRLKGGTRIRDLNRRILAPEGLALANMGSFDGQTIAGAVNTGTHGTGIGLSTIADLVRSVELVTVMPDGDQRATRMYRIEPSEGITDPAAFRADQNTHGMGLIQDDKVFYSAVVGYGCMGVVYAYTLKVRDYYWLKEHTETRSWLNYSSISDDYTGDFETSEIDDSDTPPEAVPEDVPALIRNHRHAQFLVNLPSVHHPDKSRPQITVMERTHDIADIEDKPEDWEELVDNAAGEDNKWLDISDDRWPPERRKTTAQDLSRALGNAFHPLKNKSKWGGTLESFFFKPAADNEPFVKKRTDTAWYIALRRLRDNVRKNKHVELTTLVREGIVTESQVTALGVDLSETVQVGALQRKGIISQDDFESIPDKKLKPAPPSPPAISTDVAVPLHQLEDAVEEVFQIADNVYQEHEVDPVWRKAVRGIAQFFGGDGPEPRDERFKIHFGSPMGIRFIAPSDHYLSAAFDQWSAMIEVPFPVEAANAQLRPEVPNVSQSEMIEIAKDALTEIETTLVQKYDGRPHMGKFNTLDRSTLTRLYDNFEGDGSWLQTYHRFNFFGIFDNAWTDQFDISQDE